MATRRWTALILAAVLGVAGLLLAACSDVPAMTVTIVSEDWNGWDENHEATPKTVTLQATKDAEVTVDGLGAERITVRVVSVKRGLVEIETSRRMAPENSSGGLNLNNLKGRFAVTLEEPARFATPSMDAGVHYEVTLAVRN